MPPIGLLLGNVDFANLFLVLKQGAAAGPYPSLADAQKVGAVTLNYGVFINTIISFVIVAFAVFFLIRRINRLKHQGAAPAELTTKECPLRLPIAPIALRNCNFRQPAAV